MKAEWTNKNSLEIPEITAGYGSVSWSDYKTGTSCDSVVLQTVKAIPVKQLLSILPNPYNETVEDSYSQGFEDGWDACLKAIKKELDCWENKNE